MDTAEKLQKTIAAEKATVGIVGMGYVGKALAELVNKKSFPLIGFGRTTDTSLLKSCDIILICVQTPIDEAKNPDLQYLKKAIRQVAAHLRKGHLIIIESSVSVGTTRKIVLPMLKQSHLKEGIDYFLAFSPERVDPGNKHFPPENIPKIVSGLGGNSQKLAVSFYKKIIKKVVPVSSLETAELVKLFENTFRFVNISLVNDMESYAKLYKINMWEVVSAASTKPFGFLAHYPSPGVGGHCIPVDPFYLLNDANKNGIPLKLIQDAEKINDQRPRQVTQRALDILRQDHQTYPYSYHSAGSKGGKSKHAPRFKVLLIGLAYKPDVDDIRESPALKIWEQLEKRGCIVSYHDPYVPSYKNKRSQDLSPELIKEYNLIIITTNHSNIKYSQLADYGVPMLDTRNTYTDGIKASHIYDL